jgi:hypothetical protein
MLKINRNDTVTIQMWLTVKLKKWNIKAESLVASGQWVVVKE